MYMYLSETRRWRRRDKKYVPFVADVTMETRSSSSSDDDRDDGGVVRDEDNTGRCVRRLFASVAEQYRIGQHYDQAEQGQHVDGHLAADRTPVSVLHGRRMFTCGHECKTIFINLHIHIRDNKPYYIVT